jgi:hypothetical protein
LLLARYPFNLLRNVARSKCRAAVVLLLDADLEVFGALHLSAGFWAAVAAPLADANVAVALPTFEVRCGEGNFFFCGAVHLWGRRSAFATPFSLPR